MQRDDAFVFAHGNYLDQNSYLIANVNRSEELQSLPQVNTARSGEYIAQNG